MTSGISQQCLHKWMQGMNCGNTLKWPCTVCLNGRRLYLRRSESFLSSSCILVLIWCSEKTWKILSWINNCTFWFLLASLFLTDTGVVQWVVITAAFVSFINCLTEFTWNCFKGFVNCCHWEYCFAQICWHTFVNISDYWLSFCFVVHCKESDGESEWVESGCRAPEVLDCSRWSGSHRMAERIKQLWTASAISIETFSSCTQGQLTATFRITVKQLNEEMKINCGWIQWTK